MLSILGFLSCRWTIPGVVSEIRSELLSTRNIEGYPNCISYWDFHTLTSLECDAVGPLLGLLEDDTVVPNFGLWGQYEVHVGDLAFFALGDMDPQLWTEVAYIDGRAGFWISQDTPERTEPSLLVL